MAAERAWVFMTGATKEVGAKSIAGAAEPAVRTAFLTVIISHGALAVELKQALEHLMGPQPEVAALAIPADEPLQETRRRLRELLRAMCGEARAPAARQPVVFLTDLFGGTPANLALGELRRRKGSFLLTGANLPMLVRLMEVAGEVPTAQAVEEAAAAGRRFIRVEHNG